MERSNHEQKARDIEYGFKVYNTEDLLYPTMIENPRLQWSFIRKVYTIISMQLLLTAIVASMVIFYHPIPQFIVTTMAGVIAYIAIIISTFLRT